MDLKALIRHVPDYPKPGILFYDITTLLRDPMGYRVVVDRMSEPFVGSGIDIVVGVESRGFILGGAVAERLGAGFVPIRKPNKLPADKAREEYALEYGTDAVEIHRDAIRPGQRVLIVDDLLATGGTMAATLRLLTRLDATIVGTAFLIELAFLKGRERLAGYPIDSLIVYP